MLQVSIRLVQLIVVQSWENGTDLDGSVAQNTFSMSFIADALTVRVSDFLPSWKPYPLIYDQLMSSILGIR